MSAAPTRNLIHSPNDAMRHTRIRKKSEIVLVGDGTAKVELTQGQWAIIDADDIRLVAGWKWHAVHSRGTWYARANQNVDGRFIALPMHRLIAGLTSKDDTEPDHIDRNGLNNRKDNLRIANGTIQKLNQRRYKNNISGMTGVHLRPDGQWQATISIAGRKLNLGNFSTTKDAIQARASAVKIVALMLNQVAPSLAKREAA